MFRTGWAMVALAIGALLLHVDAQSYACPSGWRAAPPPIEGGTFKCYKVSTATASWADGDTTCNAFYPGSTLASFVTQAEFDTAALECRGSSWPDMSGWAWSGVFAPTSTTDRTVWRFSNGEDPTFLRDPSSNVWLENEPSGGGEACAFFGFQNTRYLNDGDCSAHLYCMCSINAADDSTPSGNPSPSPSSSPSATVSPSASPTASPSASPSVAPSSSTSPTTSPTASSSATPSPSISPTTSPTASSSVTPSPSTSPTTSPTASSSVTPSASTSPTTSPTPSSSVTPSPTSSPTASISVTPSPSNSPTTSPTASSSVTPSPSTSPTTSPTASSSVTPSASTSPTTSPTPSSSVTPSPTSSPTASISVTPSPSTSPTTSPTPSISVTPSTSASPTTSPTVSISVTPSPSTSPTTSPTASMSVTPSTSASPTTSPTASISVTPSPSASPTSSPTSSISASKTPGLSPSSSSSRTPTASPTGTRTATPSSTRTPTITPSPTVTRTARPSSTATRTATPSSTRTPTVTPSPTVTPTVTPSSTVTPTVTPSSTVTPSVTPTVTPSSTITPTPSTVPQVSPVSNVMASVNPQVPVIDITVPQTEGGSAEGPSVGVTSAFQDLQVGGDEATTISASDITVRVENRTTAASASVETVIYSTVLPDSTTTFEQSFAFHQNASESEFAQVGFQIGANTLKWSLNFTGGGQARNSTVRYRLSALTSTADVAIVSSTAVVTSRTDFPAANMTTYFFPLLATSATTSSSSRELAARLAVFDVAKVDGEIVPIVSHRVVLLDRESPDQLPEYVLELTFPPFTTSLFYDPAISMGQLLNPDRGQKSSGGDSSVMLIGAAVAIPIALVVVLAVAIGGALYYRVRRQRAREASRRAMHASTMYVNATVTAPVKLMPDGADVAFDPPTEDIPNDMFAPNDEDDAMPGC